MVRLRELPLDECRVRDRLVDMQPQADHDEERSTPRLWHHGHPSQLPTTFGDTHSKHARASRAQDSGETMMRSSASHRSIVVKPALLHIGSSQSPPARLLVYEARYSTCLPFSI